MNPIRTFGLSAALLLALSLGFGAGAGLAAEGTMRLPPPSMKLPAPAGPELQTAILAGGCFWGVQGVFEHVKGVRLVLSGYAGGSKASADYNQVSRGTTNHAESVQIQFDPREISYGEILQIFFSVALDPTEVDRQGPDSGRQYRSEIFYANDAQKTLAQACIAELDKAKLFARPIATRVDPDSGFYPAEAYHQDYLVHNPTSMYIVINDLPKIANLKRLFPEIYLDKPVLVPPGRSAS